jgi:ParB-like chromosome segregation protein Spo0J
VSEQKIEIIPLYQLKPLPRHFTTIGREELNLLRKNMEKFDDFNVVDPILVRRMTPEEIGQVKEKYPDALYEIIDGHTRYEVAKAFKWTGLRAIVVDCTRDEAVLLNYYKNKARGRVDEAKVSLFIHSLRQKGWTTREIAEKLGLNEDKVLRMLKAAGIEGVAMKKAMEYAYSKGKPVDVKALEVVAEAPPQKQADLVEAIMKGRLSARQAEVAREAIERGMSKEEAAKFARKAKREEITSEAHPEAKLSTQELTCPKCGARAIINWNEKTVMWD